MRQQQDQRPPCFQLQELCQRLRVNYRDARYLCEKGWLPEGVDRQPGRGNHRQLTPAQAVWLGIVLRLKACGLKTQKAARIASFAQDLNGRTGNLVWAPPFSPFDSAFPSDGRWYIEVGDMRLLRLVTSANPRKPGREEIPWIDMDSCRHETGVAPVVCIQVDLSALVLLLQGGEGDRDTLA